MSEKSLDNSREETMMSRPMKNLAGRAEHEQLRARLQREKLKLATFGMREYHLRRRGAELIANADIVVNFDNDRETWGTRGPLGVENLSPERIVDFISEVDAVVVMSGAFFAISEQLDRLGVGRCFGFSLLLEDVSDEERVCAEQEAALIRANAEHVGAARGLLADGYSVSVFDAMLAERQSLKEWERAELLDFFWVGTEYFPPDIPSYRFTAHEVFVDAGAYTGDTIETFLEKVSFQYDRIYAFEPDVKNYTKLEAFCEGKENISLHRAGLYSRSTTLEFLADGTTSSALAEVARESLSVSCAPSTVEVCALDDILDGSVSFIKMDIEGAELEALRGAERSIVVYRPKLAICVYHKVSDFWEIPLYLKKIVPDYRLYVRHHGFVGHTGTILYAVSDGC